MAPHEAGPRGRSRPLRSEIWRHEHLRDRSLRGRLYALIRGILITGTVFRDTKAVSRAAALSYSSLLALGPLVAITMLIAGFVLDKKDPEVAIRTVDSIIKFVAPPVAQYESLSRTDAAHHAGASLHAHPALTDMIAGFVRGSKSGAAGTLGAVSLLGIVLMLFNSVENAFNEIWGVRRGRSILVRIVVYWTIVSLGAVLFFASLTALGAGAFVNVFVGRLPYGHDLLRALRWLLPLCSVALVILLLFLFYRYVPNTHVRWHAALTGAVVATALIFANNLLAFFYFRQVLQSRSLYGSVGIVPILMLGLYVFWLFVLIGGQVSYAVQNVRLLTRQAGWHRLSSKVREMLVLSVFLAICRRFRSGVRPYDANEISEVLGAPTQFVNECLNRLADLGLVAAIQPHREDGGDDPRYLPARPLESVTLAEFRRLDAELGEDDGATDGIHADPIMLLFEAEAASARDSALLDRPLADLIAENPLSGARAAR